MPSMFEELCAQRNVLPDEWKKTLASPIIAEKCLLDMSDRELEEHYLRVEERAENTKEDRSLLVLERAQEGRLERQAAKIWAQSAKDDRICADQVPEMLEALRFELSNTEVHYLLRRFEATDGFDMIPEAELTKRQWFCLIGETLMLKDTYKHINPEAFEVCYETMIHNLTAQKNAGLEGSDEWPHLKTTGPVWSMEGGLYPGYKGPLKPYVWGMQSEVEQELMRQVAEAAGAEGAEGAEGARDAGRAK